MTMPSEINNKRYDKLVIEGCGTRCAAVIGSIAALEKEGKWEPIRDIVASSAGAFPAFFAAIGMNSSEMMDTINAVDEKTILHKTTLSKIPFFGQPLSILKNYGLSKPLNLILFAKKLLKERGFSETLTFKQHAKLRERNPTLKNIHLTAVNNSTTTGVLTIFSCNQSETQDVEMAEAFAAALAYPFTFIPVSILIDGKFCQFSDGGTRDNLAYSLFSRREWENCLGIKLDTHDEVFKPPYQHPHLFNLIFQLLPDNDYIYKHFPNIIQLHDGDINNPLKPVTLIERTALYISGFLATNERLKNFGSEEQKKLTDSSNFTNDMNNEELALNEKLALAARTKYYKNLILNPSSSQYLTSHYYSRLMQAYHEIASWNDEVDGCGAHYNALIDQLKENPPWTIGEYFRVDYQLTQIRFDLFLLLRERAAKIALLSEATPTLISDVILAYLQTNDFKTAYEFLLQIQKNPILNLKLKNIHHHPILKILTQNSIFSKEKEKLIDLIKMHHENLLKTYPGAFECYLIVQFGNLLQAKQFSKIENIVKKMQQVMPVEFLDRIIEAALEQFKFSGQHIKFLKILSLSSLEEMGCERPKIA